MFFDPDLDSSPNGYVAGSRCTVLAFFLILLQYNVSEALYGNDGDNGPCSQLFAQ